MTNDYCSQIYYASRRLLARRELTNTLTYGLNCTTPPVITNATGLTSVIYYFSQNIYVNVDMITPMLQAVTNLACFLPLV